MEHQSESSPPVVVEFTPTHCVTEAFDHENEIRRRHIKGNTISLPKGNEDEVLGIARGSPVKLPDQPKSWAWKVNVWHCLWAAETILFVGVVFWTVW